MNGAHHGIVITGRNVHVALPPLLVVVLPSFFYHWEEISLGVGRQLIDFTGIVAPQNLHLTGFLLCSDDTIFFYRQVKYTLKGEDVYDCSLFSSCRYA